MINLIRNFLCHYNQNPSNLLEATADQLLTPLYWLLGGKSFVALQNDKDKISYTTGRHPSWFFKGFYRQRQIVEDNFNMHASLKSKAIFLLNISSLALIPVAILGGVLKVASLLDSKTRNIYWNWSNPMELKSLSGLKSSKADKEMSTLMQTCENRHLLAQLYKEIVVHPERYFQYEDGLSIFPNTIKIPGFQFSECACSKVNRVVHVRRQWFEAEILKNAVKQFPPHETKTLRYVSFGSGKLLQDFINIGLLIKAGYRHLSISFIDLNFDPEINKEFINFIEKIKAETGIEIDVVFYTSLDDYFSKTNNMTEKSRKNPHIISAIDLYEETGYMEHIFALQKSLEVGGHVYFDVYDREQDIMINYCWGNDEDKFVSFEGWPASGPEYKTDQLNFDLFCRALQN